MRVHELSLARGHRQLLDKLSFELDRGCALLLQGPNGSGKSSLLRALLGLAVTSRGEVILAGEPFEPGSGRLCAHTLYQGHASGLKRELDALANLALGAALDGSTTDPSALSEALATAGISRESRLEVHRLSQGQKQRLVLARLALANLLPAPARPLWLLDEPSAALDRAGSALLDDLLCVHLGRGGAAIVATHLPVLATAAASLRPRTLEL